VSPVSGSVRTWPLKAWSVAIALLLWLQVHGQGEGSLSMDVPLQVQGLEQDMIIVNDLPDTVRITVRGLQARLNELKPQQIHVPVMVGDLKEPGVVEKALDVDKIDVPPGLVIDKIQPDRIQLQVDHVVTRPVPVMPRFDLPQGWHAEKVVVTPATARLSGPEVWLGSLDGVETAALRPPLAPGPFSVRASIVSPSGKAIRLESEKAQFQVTGVLVFDDGQPQQEKEKK